MEKEAFRFSPELAELKTKVEGLLAEAYPGIHVELEPTPSKLGGYVVFHEFSGVPTWDRQNAVWHTLSGKLTPEERSRIGGFVILAPEELPALQSTPSMSHVGKSYVRPVDVDAVEANIKLSSRGEG